MVTPIYHPNWQSEPQAQTQTPNIFDDTGESASGLVEEGHAHAHAHAHASFIPPTKEAPSGSTADKEEGLGGKEKSKNPLVEYVQRGWCRIEMFLNANVPVNISRKKLFGGKLAQVIAEEVRRPHVVFGTREKDLGVMPVILPPLRDHLFARYHPGEGTFTSVADAVIVNSYVKELLKMNENLKV
jgi:hypothetical protein